MKKLFTFAAAILASFSLWATDKTPTNSFDISAVTAENWGTWLSGTTPVIDAKGFHITGYMGRQSSQQAWIGFLSGNTAGSQGTPWTAFEGAEYSLGSAAYGNDGRYMTMRTNRTMYFRVTGCSEAHALVQVQSNGTRGVTISAYEYTTERAAEAAATQTTAKTDNTMEEIGVTGLDPAKTYEILIAGTADGNSNFFEIAFIASTKTVVSTEESLTAVTVNDVAISATDLASLVSNKYLFLADAYVTAPVVKFTKHTVITYDDQSTKEKDEVIEVTSQPETTTWSASATINGNSYYVYTSKAASRTVTYMYGEQVLGTEIVAANGNPAEYAQYETMPLATFGGWYKDADLTQAVANIAAEVISADATYYAKFTKAFLSESVNIEQLVLDNGTSYDIKSALTAAHFAYTDVDALDTLNDVDKKTNRNYAFLGLKVKKATSYLAFNLQQGHSVKVRMGNVAEAFTLKVNGAALDLATKTLANASVDDANVWEYTATDGDALIEFTGFTKDKTVVFKQIMIDEPIAAVVLPEPSAYALSLAEVQNGSLAVKVNDAAIDLSKKNVLIGATVTITATPDEGYKVVDVQVNGVSLNAVEGVYSFEMPAEAVVISATFEVDPTTAISNTEAGVKAVKFFQNGQLMIEKNGVIYNAQGAIVK